MSAFIPRGSYVFTLGGNAATVFTAPDGSARTGPAGLWPGQSGSFFRSVIQLPNGQYGCRVQQSGGSNYSFEVYDASWNSLGGWASGFFMSGLNGNFSDAWYAVANGSAGARTIRKLDATGVLATYIISSVFSGTQVNDASCAVSPDEAVAYFGTMSGGASGVLAWDLVGNASLGTLIAQVGGGPCADNGIIVLQDGSIVVGWRNAGLMRYSAAGVLLNTYTLPDTYTAWYQLAISSDASKFNVWYYYGSAETIRVVQIRASDGAILQSFTAAAGASFMDNGFGEVLVGLGTAAVPLPTPSAPQIQCAPQTTVGNGGTGAAGCNTGGVGVVRAYTGPWGDVPDHDDPVDGETFTGKDGQAVELWVEINHVDDPSGDVEQILRAMVPLADPSDYHGGYKRAGLMAVGDVEHALGNERSGFEAATVDIRIFDEESAA